ncbi:MAG TPA: glycoside hydrolase family 3 N-terminal domain-containing protein [Candidatus Acidoferrales bacterium]|nr:glycoside hydrolase family 3 N-terminal domain-containing protein [Candidatus Acidoferrales bacterium]
MVTVRGNRRAPRTGMLALLVALCAGCLGATPVAPSTVAGRPTSSLTAPASPDGLSSSVAPSPTAAPTSSVATSESAAPSSSPPRATAATCPARVLASLTEPQRIGQLFLLGLTGDRLGASERADIAAWHFGSAWFTTPWAVGVAAVRSVADAVQALASQATTGGVGFLVAANQEGGLVQALSGPGFSTIPSALGQGALTPAVLQVSAERWGLQLRAAGVNLDLAPVADVVPPGTDAENEPIGQLQREYGHDPATAGSHVFAFSRGMAQAGVATTVKHFPGLGRVRGNTDFTGGVTDTVTTPRDPYLEPFNMAIAAGVPFVMVSLATYERIDPAHLAAFSSRVIDGMLRRDLHFAGVVVSDDLGVAAAIASTSPPTRALEFLDAGGDLIVSQTPAPAIAMARRLVSLATTDAALRQRVDDAVLRILRAKEALGLLPCGG